MVARAMPKSSTSQRFRAESLSNDCSQFRAPCPWSLMEIALETPETMIFLFQDILFGSRRGRTRCFITGSAGQLTNQECGSQRRVCSSQQRECGALGTPGRLDRVDPWAPDLSKSRGREDCVTMTRDKLWPWLASVQPCSKGQNTDLLDRGPSIHEKRFPYINNLITTSQTCQTPTFCACFDCLTRYHFSVPLS